MFLQDNTTPEWLARLPMTKAVVRAMDTVQAFVQRDYSRKVPTFVVAGASKRGWTTWTTAAVDKRVVAMIPIVMPMGNMTPMINTMYRVYGNWSFALQDYINADVMHYLGTPSFSAMEAIIDPMSYYSRWHTLPKYVIAACGDEFFLPDSTRFFWDKLPHPKILRMAPNAEHSMFTAPAIDVVYGIDTFVQRLIRKMSLPTWDFELTYSNTTASIRAWTTGDYQPTAVYLYKATTLSTTQRDFRLIRCAHKEWQCLNPVLWHSKALPIAPGQTEWTASVSAPSAGWTGFLLEAVFPGGYTTGDPYNPDKWIRVTSSVNVVPDRLPFAPCQTTNSCQPSIPWNP
jgi:PhoPQ-activated pathogenicity-related protein